MNNFRRYGSHVKIYPQAKLCYPENMEIGSHVIIDDFAFIVAKVDIIIGNHVHIASHVSITGGGPLVIRDFVNIATGSRVLTGTDDFSGNCLAGATIPERYRNTQREGVTIGRHAFVGANAVIMSGVAIGEGAVIGACSFVNRTCEPWTFYVGCPARPIKQRLRERILELETQLLAEEKG